MARRVQEAESGFCFGPNVLCLAGRLGQPVRDIRTRLSVSLRPGQPCRHLPRPVWGEMRLRCAPGLSVRLGARAGPQSEGRAVPDAQGPVGSSFPAQRFIRTGPASNCRRLWADGKPLPFPRKAPAEVWAGELGRGLGASLEVPSPYLLFKAVRGQEEAVQRHEVALQEPHEQHQVHPICKLEGEGRLKALGPGAPQASRLPGAHPSPRQGPEGYLPRQAAGRGEGRRPEAGRPALRQARPTSGWPRTEPPPMSLVSAALACPEH